MNLLTESLANKQQKIKKQLFDELNIFRKNPTSVIPRLNKRKLCYSSQPPRLVLFSPNHPQKGLTTSQGPGLISQLTGTLYSRDSMSPLFQNLTLSSAAQKIAQSFESCKSLSQIKLSESMAKQMRNELNNSQQYEFVEKIKCLIGVGFDQDEFEPLLSLLIDDGNKERKNRELLLDRNLKFVGIGSTVMQHKKEFRIGVYLLTTNISIKK